MIHRPGRLPRLRSSRQRYRSFVQDYKQQRLDDKTEADVEPKRAEAEPGQGVSQSKEESKRKRRTKRREY